MSDPGFIAVAPHARAALAPLLGSERPGPLAGWHALREATGFCRVDRWPDPRLIVAGVGYDAQIAGDPVAFDPALLEGLARPSFIAADPRFEPLLRDRWPELVVWNRVVSCIDSVELLPARGATIRRIEHGDEPALHGLNASIAWIISTQGGPDGVARRGVAFGAFVAGQLASVAIPYHQGERFEDLGVVTEPRFRGRGLSSACASRVVRDVLKRGRVPSWTTSPDNLASLRVAGKLRARKQRDDVLYVLGKPPVPA